QQQERNQELEDQQDRLDFTDYAPGDGSFEGFTPEKEDRDRESGDHHKPTPKPERARFLNLLPLSGALTATGSLIRVGPAVRKTSGLRLSLGPWRSSISAIALRRSHGKKTCGMKSGLALRRRLTSFGAVKSFYPANTSAALHG